MAILIATSILISALIGMVVSAFFLHFTTRILKVEGASYKKALKVKVIFTLMGIIPALITFGLFSMLKIPFANEIVMSVVGFFIANFLYKKYYQTDTRKNIKIYVVEYVLTIIVTFTLVFLIVLPIRLFVFQPFTMQGASMEPNLKDGQYMLFKEYDKNYQRGEVIVFKYPKNEEQYFLKRIIGLPGEKVWIKDGEITIYNSAKPDGFILDESAYLPNDAKTAGEIAIALKNDEYFVMGDNRMFSSDSRSWGPLKSGLIIGKYWTTFNLPTK
jgi:signal peptidase I